MNLPSDRKQTCDKDELFEVHTPDRRTQVALSVVEMPEDLGKLLGRGSRIISVIAETNTHDAWFRSKVQEVLKDPRAATRHSEVMHQAQALIDHKRREHS